MKLCVALDLPNSQENLALVKSIKDYDIWLKVGFRTYIRDGKPFMEALKEINPDLEMILFDAQTSGGLLICVDERKSKILLKQLSKVA